MRLTIEHIFAALLAAAATCAAAPTDEPSWRDLMSSFESINPTDFIHLGDDGVLRHFNESGAVLNYAPLSPQQISQALSDTSSRDTEEDKEHLSQVFKGVDGRTVRDPAFLYPPAEIYPTNFLNNKKPSDMSEVPRSDLGLGPRQHCPSRSCTPKENFFSLGRRSSYEDWTIITLCAWIRLVTVRLDAEALDTGGYVGKWKMASESSRTTGHTDDSSVHVSGQIVFVSNEDEQLQTQFSRFERLVDHKQCLDLLRDDDAFLGLPNIYKAFSDVVDYGEVYRGVHKSSHPVRQPRADLIATLAELGIPMWNIVPFEEWLDRMRSFAGDEAANPAKRVDAF
ncbi:hypothetical protein CNMCM5623_001890 [Aspergillus felis]|uniref:Uncharacterized protein n=1 Tax=Aspergillus felis TaxID=1287682 RepID=A0A8H6Q9W4_9EURO|nr:hypothetical protein CNMCM5623_001890 [Aspergillus felis]